MTIKAIETRYAGCRFRSRLEARWAVFFDTLGIEWEYEPEGFSLPSGPYLPDFKLPQIHGAGAWFEVKPPAEPSGHRSPWEVDDDPRWADLVSQTGLPIYVAKGMPRPDRDVVWGGSSYDGFIEMWSPYSPFEDKPVEIGWDNGRAFCICETCGIIGIEFEGRSWRICQHVPEYRSGNADHPRILNAYIAARSARFEHGERG